MVCKARSHESHCWGGAVIQNDGLKKSEVLRAGLGSPIDLRQVIFLNPWAKRKRIP